MNININDMSPKELKAYLQEQHMPKSATKRQADGVFELAWQYGHPNGNTSIAHYYMDMSYLFK